MLSIEEIHKYPNVMPRIRNDPTTTTLSTKINVIETTLLEYTQNALDLILTILGLALNLSIVFLVLVNSTLRVSSSCYAISLVGSNLVILIEPIQRILRSFFEINLAINLDYVLHVSSYTSLMTIVIFTIENYIATCDRHASLYESYAILSKTLRRMIIVWLMSILITAMELHLYEHFEKDDMDEIYAASTIILLMLTLFILVLLHCATFYELFLLKSVEGECRRGEFDNFRLSLGLSTVFFLTMVPYRIAKVTAALDSKAKWCCSKKLLEILYFLIKIFPAVCPIVFYVTIKKFRKAVWDGMRRLCHKNLPLSA